MSDAPTGTEGPGGEHSWVGVEATPNQAMEWGIALCGQLAAAHAEGEVVGGIAPETIVADRFGRPSLPAPDGTASHEPWVDVAALAEAIGGLVPHPPPELIDALRPPYASAVALGQELQDAQQALGFPVAPIPFDAAPPATLGGAPVEVPPDAPVAPVGPLVNVLSPEDLERAPNPWVLLAITVVVLGIAVAVGIGWR